MLYKLLINKDNLIIRSNPSWGQCKSGVGCKPAWLLSLRCFLWFYSCFQCVLKVAIYVRFYTSNATIVAIRKFVALEVLMAAYRKRKNKDGSISHTATIRLKVNGLSHSETKTLKNKKIRQAWVAHRETELKEPSVIEKVAHKGAVIH